MASIRRILNHNPVEDKACADACQKLDAFRQGAADNPVEDKAYADACQKLEAFRQQQQQQHHAR